MFVDLTVSTYNPWGAADSDIDMEKVESDKSDSASRQTTRFDTALRDSASRAAAILNTTVDGIITIDQRGIIESMNPAAERLFGYSFTEVVGRNVNMLMPEPYSAAHDSYLRNYLSTGRAKIIGIGREVVGLRKDGTTFPMHLGVSEVALEESGIEGRIFTGIVRDLSDQKRLERELLEISDREQRRIGQDLHDGLGQQLAGIGFLSKSLQNRLAAKDLPDAVEAGKIAELVARTIGQARALARGLHPVDLKASGLMSALEELTRNVEAMFRIECTFICEQPVLLRDNAVAVHAYRIAQEAINNAVRHGHAKHVVVRLTRPDHRITLSIEDDGGGFDKTKTSTGMGLRIMNYRSALIGGTLNIDRRIPIGTTVQCSFTELESPGEM
jgi:two-component system, LuxR family, sensor kinase FixL